MVPQALRPADGTRTVRVAARGGITGSRGRKAVRARPARTAETEIRVARVELKAPGKSRRTLPVTAVLASGTTTPPKGGRRLSWPPLSSDARPDLQSAVDTVRRYERRWTIEEYFPSASLKCNPGPPPERGRSPGGPGGPGLKDFPARGPDSAWNAAAVPSDPGVSGPSAGRKAPRRDRPGKGGRSPTETRTVPPVCSFPPASRQVQAPQGGCARPIASAGVR